MASAPGKPRSTDSTMALPATGNAKLLPRVERPEGEYPPILTKVDAWTVLEMTRHVGPSGLKGGAPGLMQSRAARHLKYTAVRQMRHELG